MLGSEPLVQYELFAKSVRGADKCCPWRGVAPEVQVTNSAAQQCQVVLSEIQMAQS